MSKHTPGPWRYMENDGGEFVPMVLGSDFHEIAFIYKHRQNKSETQANAALVAAAPDLLAALETCAHELSFQCSGSSGHDAFLAARAAIAKAKGT